MKLHRPALPKALIRTCAALLEISLLVTLGAMLLDGAIQNPDSEGPTRMPIMPGIAILPIVLVSIAYGVQRVIRPRRFAFAIAGAIVASLGGALRSGITPLERLRDGFIGLIFGAIVTGFVISLDDESTTLLEGGAQPWRELFLGVLLVTFGAMPAAIFGGFVLAVVTIAMGLVVLGRCTWQDAKIVVPQRSAAAAFRAFLAMSMGLLGFGILLVSPFMSLGLMRRH